MTQLCFPIMHTCQLTLSYDSWTLHHYEEHAALVNHPETEALLAAQISEVFQKPFCRQIHIQSVPVLLAVFPKQKTLRIGTVRLAQEVTLLDALKHDSATEPEGHEWDTFKAHCQAILAIDPQQAPSVWEHLTHTHPELPDFHEDEQERQINEKVAQLQKQIQRGIKKYRPTLMERVTDYGLVLVANYPLLRLHLLKFVAMLPSLDHDQSGAIVKRMWLEALRRLCDDSKSAQSDEERIPFPLFLTFQTLWTICRWVPANLLSGLIRANIRWVAKRFIAGENIQTAISSLQELRQTGRDATLDQLGELVVSQQEADHYANAVIELIQGLKLHLQKGERNAAGIPRAHVSIKVSALCHDFKAEAFEYTYEQIAPRLIKIFEAAQQEGVFINVDAEHHFHRDAVLGILRKVLVEHDAFHQWEDVGIVLQAYLRDAHEHFQDILALAQERQLCMPIRLVKGAYWDAETIEADAHSYNAPQFLNKEETDLCFRQMIYKILEASPHVQLCIASHNTADHCYSEVLRNTVFPESKAIEHQCLHMTYEGLSKAMTAHWVVRNYVPVGNLLVGMSYLVRRIMENSSQVGVLTQMRLVTVDTVTPTPLSIHQNRQDAESTQPLDRDKAESVFDGRFGSAPLLRPHKAQHWKWMTQALESFKAEQMDQKYDNAFEVHGEWQSIVSSSDPDLKVGQIQWAAESDVDVALNVLAKEYQTGDWAGASALERASVMFKAAELLLVQRTELSALIMMEAGKSVLEALADVDEAIDFLQFYGREAIRLEQAHPELTSRGVVAVISPWNFPLAIPCGMASSALVTGNTVLLKPAEQTPLIAQKLVNILHEAGVPQNALVHLPGEGETVGAAIVKDPRIHGILFTGSKPVGLWIFQEANARPFYNDRFQYAGSTRVITEMGGKNAIIVTNNAELDEAVAGCLYSAFGHAGQKCSAASRILVDHSIKDRFLERFQQACLDIQVGRADDFGTYLNPIISAEDQTRLQQQAKEAAAEASKVHGKVWVDRSDEDGLPGHCVGPVLIELPYEAAWDKESYAQKELFGPVVHVIGYESLSDAVRLFNATEYGLTGGIFSQSQDDIDALVPLLDCGNLYVNRPCTGARVGIEPFGGFKHSGTGPKAGSSDYVRCLLASPLKQKHAPSTTSRVEPGTEASTPAAHAYLTQAHPQNSIFFAQHWDGFETLLQKLGYENTSYADLQQWIQSDAALFWSQEHLNHTIPGQQSFNDFHRTRESLLLIAYDEQPTAQALSVWMHALLVGCQVQVVSRNVAAAQTWKQLVGYWTHCGVSLEEVSHHHLTEDTFQQWLSTSWGCIWVDGALEYVEHVSQIVSTHVNDLKYLPTLLSPYDGYGLSESSEQTKQFCFTRSLAINIMRHGAPLS